MKASMRRLMAIESSLARENRTGRDQEDDIRMMSCAERALTELALGLLLTGEAKWSDYDQEAWGRHGPVMVAKAEIERADADKLGSLASAMISRGRHRRLGVLEDMRLGPFRAWEELSAFPPFTQDSWEAIKALAARLRDGLACKHDVVLAGWKASAERSANFG